MEQRRYINIIKAIKNNIYKDLGTVYLDEEIAYDDIRTIQFIVIPHEGIHSGKPYTILLKFQENEGWPFIYIDSEIYDKIKTKQYLSNTGRSGKPHKGICIRKLSYAYAFSTNFKIYCGEKWENYIYNIIVVFNNLQDFEKGSGFQSSYKEILNI